MAFIAGMQIARPQNTQAHKATPHNITRLRHSISFIHAVGFNSAVRHCKMYS